MTGAMTGAMIGAMQLDAAVLVFLVGGKLSFGGWLAAGVFVVDDHTTVSSCSLRMAAKQERHCCVRFLWWEIVSVREPF